VGEIPAGAQACPTNFLAVNLDAKFELVRDLAKSWDLAASGTLEPIKVTEEEVAVAKVGGTYPSPFSSLPFSILHALSSINSL